MFQLTDDELYKCPFIMMTEAGALYLDDDGSGAAARLPAQGRIPVGGRLLGRVRVVGLAEPDREGAAGIPDRRHPARALAVSHAVSGERRPADSRRSTSGLAAAAARRSAAPTAPTPHARGIFDERGDLMVLTTHNTDFGDAFEREGDNRAYFDQFAGVGYAFGINALLYAMTH